MDLTSFRPASFAAFRHCDLTKAENFGMANQLLHLWSNFSHEISISIINLIQVSDFKQNNPFQPTKKTSSFLEWTPLHSTPFAPGLPHLTCLCSCLKESTKALECALLGGDILETLTRRCGEA